MLFPAAKRAEAVATVLEQLSRVMRRLATTGGLGLTAASVLTRLDLDGPQRLTDLAASEGVSQPSMTQLVSRLEREDLVQRAPSPEDGRVVIVTVTGAGRNLVAERRLERAAALEALLNELDLDEQAAISRALPAFARLADLANVPAVSGRADRPRPGGVR